MDTTLLFRIDALTPGTLSMARLAQYLTELARLCGVENGVHFDRVGSGSVVLKMVVDESSMSDVVARVRGAANDDASIEVKKAYGALNALLRENDAEGDIRVKGGGRLLTLPGRSLGVSPPTVISEPGEIDGVVVRVGGIDDTIPVHVQGQDGRVYVCSVSDRHIAQRLAALLYGDPIRLHGNGKWTRLTDGAWRLDSLKILSWETLDPMSAADVFKILRGVAGNRWRNVKDIDAEVARIREGQ